VILYTAAHGGFSKEAVPLGGGAAVFDHLVEEWSRTQPFPFQTITPSILASSDSERGPSGHDLVSFSERDYARFCYAFEAAATREIMRHDPASIVVLATTYPKVRTLRHSQPPVIVSSRSIMST
jgi:hypothetical protein